MPKLVCVTCEVELRCEKNGVKVVEMMNHNQTPYKIWDTDKWKCPMCGVEIIAGFAQAPIMEHFEEGFSDYLMHCQAKGDEVVYDKELLP